MASTSFRDLRKQLADAESQLASARQHYNDAVRQVNSTVATIPWMWIAPAAGVRRRDFYEAPSGHEAPPTVAF